jgi:hypothetical protein
MFLPDMEQFLLDVTAQQVLQCNSTSWWQDDYNDNDEDDENHER